MTEEKRERMPVTPVILLISGVVVGIAGLVMLLVGIGGSAPTTVQVPGINVNVSTSSLALVVMALGFGVAVATLATVMAYAKIVGDQKRKIATMLAVQRPDLPTDDIVKLMDATARGNVRFPWDRSRRVSR